MEIDFYKLIESVANRELQFTEDEITIKFEIKRRLTKKEYKVLIHIFQGGDEEAIINKLNLDRDRFTSILKSAKNKIRSNLGKFAKI